MAGGRNGNWLRSLGRRRRSDPNRRCLRLCPGLSETLASIPVNVYERKGKNSREVVRDHPAFKLLHDRPSLETTSFDFFETLQGHLCLRGNAYAQKLYRAGRVAELIPLNPDRVRIDRDSRQRIVYEVTTGTEHQMRHSPPTGSFTLRPSEPTGSLGFPLFPTLGRPLGPRSPWNNTDPGFSETGPTWAEYLHTRELSAIPPGRTWRRPSKINTEG